MRVRFVVSGLVQGVGFRAYARRAAAELRLPGFARNLADGRVETAVEGPAEAVSAYELLLRQGPRYARVDEVVRTEISGEVRLPIHFDIS